MIHVEPQPEPATFDELVRKKGNAYLAEKGIGPTQSVRGIAIQPYWRASLDDLYCSYDGICAYLCIYFERESGAGTVDHFIPKTTRAGLIYEWSNYRLACLEMNRIKRDAEDILDPFEVENHWFYLEPVSGRIYPNPHLSQDVIQMIEQTIKRLKLDSTKYRKMRTRHFFECQQRLYPEDHLRRTSPFVWREVKRLGLI